MKMRKGRRKKGRRNSAVGLEGSCLFTFLEVDFWSTYQRSCR